MSAEDAAMDRQFRFPLLERVHLLPPLHDAADFDHLMNQSVGKRGVAVNMSWLGGIVGDQLNDIVERSKLGFGGLAEYEQFFG